VDKSASGTDPSRLTYPDTPSNLRHGIGVAFKVLLGCLVVIGVMAVVIVVFIFAEFWSAVNAGAPEARRAQHNTDLLFRAFTGQVPDSVGGGTGSAGREARASEPLQGHPTPRDEMPKAIAAFAATGYTPMLDTAAGQSWCSFGTYLPVAYLPGAAPLTVSVTCTWDAFRPPESADSVAGIAIEGAVFTADLRPTLDDRGYYVLNANLIMDAPLQSAVVTVSASQ